MKSFIKKISVFVIALIIFAGVTSSVYAEGSETVSGFVVVLDDGILLDTEFGEVVVKKGPFTDKLKEMDGSLITVEGVINEKDNGTLELKVNAIVE